MIEFEVVLNLLGALAIFLFGLEKLSQSLKELGSKTLKSLLLRFSKTRWRGLATGTAVTALLDSSSVVIIFVIAFVDVHLLSFGNALAIVLGANIGTTISSQIIALRIGDYASIGLIIGIFGIIFSNTPRNKLIFQSITGIFLIFFGLHLMDMAVYPYRDSAELKSWMMQLENPVMGAAIGAFITLIIQSSSATVGIAITLAAQGILSLDAGIAIMLGAEIGTCSDTLIATLGRGRDAIRIGLFHLIMNVTTVCVGLLLFTQLKELTLLIAPNAGLARQVANAHVLFNVIGALFFLMLIPWFKRFLCWIVPAVPLGPIPMSETHWGSIK